MWKLGGRAFQEEKVAGTKALSWACAWRIHEMLPRREVWLKGHDRAEGRGEGEISRVQINSGF